MDENTVSQNKISIDELKARLDKIKRNSQNEATTKKPQEVKSTPEEISPTEDDINNRSVFVQQVDYNCTEDELKEHFNCCGQINRVTILKNHFSHKPTGSAYIEFSQQSSVEHALKLSTTILKGRQIKVQRKRENKPGMSRIRSRRRSYNPH